METSLTLDSEYHTNHQPVSLNADEMDDIYIDQEGEWGEYQRYIITVCTLRLVTVSGLY